MSAWDELFGSRKWRVAREVTGVVSWPSPGDPINVYFKAGHFEIEGPGVFQSPLSSNKGKRGVLLREVADSQDVPGSYLWVGEKVVLRIREAGALV